MTYKIETFKFRLDMKIKQIIIVILSFLLVSCNNNTHRYICYVPDKQVKVEKHSGLRTFLISIGIPLILAYGLGVFIIAFAIDIPVYKIFYKGNLIYKSYNDNITFVLKDVIPYPYCEKLEIRN